MISSPSTCRRRMSSKTWQDRSAATLRRQILVRLAAELGGIARDFSQKETIEPEIIIEASLSKQQRYQMVGEIRHVLLDGTQVAAVEIRFVGLPSMSASDSK